MKKFESGQALIIIIFAIALAITILGGVTISAITLGKNARLVQDSETAYYAAEGGLEYGLIKLNRNPTGCVNPTDNLTIETSNVVVSYSLSGAVCTVLSTATNGTVLKKFQVQATIANSKVTYCCWKEVP
ncbi:MAG: hypothetical protein Q7T50_03840 [Candidatus Magasanikbacteria bacterium]|nr:hypothetical protein [Candidatus Magasanikbacteria bacterium]